MDPRAENRDFRTVIKCIQLLKKEINVRLLHGYEPSY